MHLRRIRRPTRPARRLLIALCVAALGLAYGIETSLAGSEAPRLSKQLSDALAVAGLDPANLSALVVDLNTGSTVFASNSTLPLVPASIEKLPIALAALAVLGPNFRSRTLVLGSGMRRGAVWDGDVYLKGYGDPALPKRDVRRLARVLHSRGIVQITGAIVADESYFDSVRTAPGWKPSFFKVYSPPISALVVNRARKQKSVVDDPALAAATAFRNALRKRGVTVDGGVRTGTAPANTIRLARDSSPRLTRLVGWMNTRSDNFIAEMLLKTLGARVAGMGTTSAGAAVVQSVLAARGIPLASVSIVDGSGLSQWNRLTATTTVAILRAARSDPGLSEPFIGSLALAGSSGTLARRFVDSPGRGRIRAKTGTTALSSALAGFVDDRYAFAIFMNGSHDSPVNHWLARAAQDRFATALVEAPLAGLP